MKALHILLAAALSTAGAAIAQNAPASPPSQERVMIMQSPMNHEDGPGITLLHTEMMDIHEQVKGSPYSATATTESTQVLPDGNRIVNKQSGFVARDSQGRVRREQNMGHIGPLQADGSKVIFIHDPVAQTGYVLNPDTQTASVMKHDAAHMKMMTDMHARVGNKESHDMEYVRTEKRTAAIQSTKESLGTQQIEGVNAEGTRVTHTIPAGAIGNEQPIATVVETWTSPELHTLVLQKRSDPRFGETIYRLTNIKRAEPDPTLFQVPSGYKTEEGPHKVLLQGPPPGE
jgi:hypothetical protein